MHKHLWTWHRRLGAMLALIVIILCISGIALNHTDQLHLDQRHVESNWLLDWYGINVPAEAQSIIVNGIRISLLGDHLYAADTFIGAPYSELLGAGWNGQFIAIALGADLLLLTTELQLVEKITVADGLPAGILALGNSGQQLLVRTETGLWQADEQLLSWNKVADDTPVRWSSSQAVGGEQVEGLRRDYRGRILTWERVILDLHSGRLLGVAGPVATDLVGLMLLGLAASGLWLWSRRIG